MALAHAFVTAPGSAPDRWVLFLHGILGSGANWRTFARRLVEQHPSWGACLVDLRLHGGSLDLPAPHTVASATHDVLDLARTLPGRVDAVVGHSFGGKIALAYTDLCNGELSRTWVLDSTPSARPAARGSEGTLAVLDTLASMADVHASREAFVADVVAHGHPSALAQWLAMNLRADSPGNYRFKLDLAAVRAMLGDYFAVDLWGVVEAPPGRVVFDLVVGGRSNVFDASDRERAARCVRAHPDRVAVHTLADAGHWVHVDDPDGLYAIVRAGFVSMGE